MTSAANSEVRASLQLDVVAAADLMTPNPVSIPEEATLEELLALFADRGLSAAPVIDKAGHPHGVVSRSDILIHLREKSPGPAASEEARVRDIMTPAIFSVTPDTLVPALLEQLLALKVNQLFVVDDAGAIIGVITPLDLLKRLH